MFSAAIMVAGEGGGGAEVTEVVVAARLVTSGVGGGCGVTRVITVTEGLLAVAEAKAGAGAGAGRGSGALNRTVAGWLS